MSEYLKINGVTMPPIKIGGWKHSYEKVWSSNTGRTNDAKMTGTIKAIKEKIECTFVPLTYTQVKTVMKAINSMESFIPVEGEMNSGEKFSFIAYTGDLELSLGWDKPGLGGRYDDVSISAIER